MAKQNETLNHEQAAQQSDKIVSGEHKAKKKVFVEPEISVPVDVLEATTFFQAATSGVAN